MQLDSKPVSLTDRGTPPGQSVENLREEVADWATLTQEGAISAPQAVCPSLAAGTGPHQASSPVAR